MSSSGHVDNRNKYILILVKGPTQGLDDTTLAVEKEYAINFSEQQKKFCLSLHYNGANSYLFLNGIEIFEFIAKDSEINQLHYVWVMFQKIFQVIIGKRLDQVDMSMIFQLIMIVLMFMIF